MCVKKIITFFSISARRYAEKYELEARGVIWYNLEMDNSFALKLEKIKEWLGTGSINIFGMPMSGKDTVGVRLAEELGGRFLSGGLIIRAMESMNDKHLTDKGNLIDTNIFYEWVLPYFDKEELKGSGLVLSSIGRVYGEEGVVMKKAEESGHEIKVAVALNVSEAVVTERWREVSQLKSQNRGIRRDDESLEIFENRLKEFREKTVPVLLHYRMLGKLVEVKAGGDKDTVYSDTVEAIYKFATKS